MVRMAGRIESRGRGERSEIRDAGSDVRELREVRDAEEVQVETGEDEHAVERIERSDAQEPVERRVVDAIQELDAEEGRESDTRKRIAGALRELEEIEGGSVRDRVERAVAEVKEEVEKPDIPPEKDFEDAREVVERAKEVEEANVEAKEEESRVSESSPREAFEDSSEQRAEGEKRKGLERVPDEQVRETFSELESKEGEPRSWASEEIAEGLKRLAPEDAEVSRVYCADIREGLGLTPEEVESFTNEFQQAKEALEAEGEVRCGMVDEKVYIWRPDLDPTQLENAYGNLYYYFRDEEAFEKYIWDIACPLGIEGDDEKQNIEHLQKLASQMLTEPTSEYCVNPRLNRIRGDHVHFFNNLSGKTLSELEGEISKITKKGGRGGIRNPRFPEGEELEIALARLTAVAVSDCHLKANGTLEYAEGEISRIRIVERDLQVFGDIRMNPKLKERENFYEVFLPSPFGIVLLHLGIPSGDRTVQNPGLYPELREFSVKAQCGFIENLIPQDGTISRKNVQWTHSNALHAGDKTEIYGIEPKVGRKEINLIIEEGKREKHSWVLNYGKLEELRQSDSDNLRHIADSLWNIVYENPNRLVEDEIRIVRKLGVNYNAKPYTIRYHERSGRVSVAWTAEPESVLESIKLAMIAPSNDVIKRQIMRDLIANHPKYMRRALRQFEKNGIEVYQWWTS
ncbi:MAG: hypothetical protein EAX81_04640 [Candidatus Thorarchaeota archaeon]|nr:hypothetical protein [Candidatus Thorarchaeota archaeon]